MEIERKWMVTGWPEKDLPILKEERMSQGYVSTHPVVRIRREERIGGDTQYVLCLKSEGLLAREEIEIRIREDQFREIEGLIGLPMIQKLRKTYILADGSHLEVNHVDEGLPTEFWYAEVEYPSVQAAETWDPAGAGMEEYLSDDVTGEPGQSMAEYWDQTRLHKGR